MKTWMWAILVIVLVGGGWLYFNQSKIFAVSKTESVIEQNVKTDTQPSADSSNTESNVGMRTYVSQQYGFQFDYPMAIDVKSVQSQQISVMGETETAQLPAGSVEVTDQLFISPVPYTDFSEQEKIYDYDSCCSGRSYWYDAVKNQWLSNIIADTKSSPYSLMAQGSCALEQKFGSNTFYKIESGDEGVPTEVYYFLPTNRGYAIRFLTPYDVRGDYSSYTETYRPDPKTLRMIAQILSSVSLIGQTSKVNASCL